MEFARVALHTVRGREGMDVRKAECGSGRGTTGARSTRSTLLKALQSVPPQTCSKCKLCRVWHCGHSGVQHTASHPSQRWPGKGRGNLGRAVERGRNSLPRIKRPFSGPLNELSPESGPTSGSRELEATSCSGSAGDPAPGDGESTTDPGYESSLLVEENKTSRIS